MQPLLRCTIALSRAPFESVQPKQFETDAKVTSGQADYRQVIDLTGHCSQERPYVL